MSVRRNTVVWERVPTQELEVVNAEREASDSSDPPRSGQPPDGGRKPQTMKKKKKRRKKHPIRNFFVIVLCLVGLYYVMGLPYFNVEKIQVEGNSYYTSEEVCNMALAKTGHNIFFYPYGKNIEERLSKNPYFEEVRVGRKLPKTITISLTERVQSAALVYGDDFLVIDGNKNLLRIGDVDPKITVVEGLTMTKVKVGQQVKAKEGKLLDDCLGLISTTSEKNFFFKKIVLSEDECIAYINDNFVVRGKLKKIREMIKKGKLQKVVNKQFAANISSGTLSVGDYDYISYTP